MNQSTALSTETAAPKPMTSGGALAAFVPQTSEQLIKLSEVLARSGDMVPKAFQGNPPMIAAAMMRGMEVGLNPMQALSSIAVINGRAVLWGDALPALVQRAGHTIDVDYEGAGDTLTAVATLTRGDTGKVIVRRFGMADAKRAGLTGKAGPWTQYPQRMMAMRARSWAVRDGAADALMGLHVSDEAQDIGPDSARDVTPAPKRGGVVYADPDPVVDEIHEAVIEEAPAAPSAMDLARAAARLGTAHFRVWFNTDEGKTCRAAGLDMPALKVICDEADAAAKDEPFGLPPVDMPSPEELAQAEAEAMAAANANAQEVGE